MLAPLTEIDCTCRQEIALACRPAIEKISIICTLDLLSFQKLEDFL